MEYNKDAENIKANDLKQSLNAEKQKSLELMDKLNQERKKSNAMQEQLCDLKEEVARIKDHLAGETKNYKQICKEFEKEKAKNEILKKKCDELENALKLLRADSGESHQLKKLNADLEDRFIEIQRYANDLEQNMIDEKSKVNKEVLFFLFLTLEAINYCLNFFYGFSSILFIYSFRMKIFKDF
jgi:predicted nuclease with TOPRIM domain